MNILGIVVLVLLIVALFPAWPYSTGWGYYPSGLVGLLLIVTLILVLRGGGRTI